MEDIIVQHTIVVPPIGIQHIPQHRQHRIVRTRRDKPVSDATPLATPRLRVLEHKQVCVQKPVVKVIVSVTCAKHGGVYPRPTILDQQFQPKQVGEMSWGDLFLLPTADDIVRQVNKLTPVLFVDNDKFPVGQIPLQRPVTRLHHFRSTFQPLQPAEPNLFTALVL